MKTSEPGHVYLLDHYDNGESQSQLCFFKRVGDGYPGNESPAHTGTNCQEVLRGLIDRVDYLNNQESSLQNTAILMHLRTALYLFEYRAAERKGKLKDFFQMLEIPSNLTGIEKVKPCRTCGHIFPHDHVGRVGS